MPTAKVPPVETGIVQIGNWSRHGRRSWDDARFGALLNKSLRLGVDCLFAFNNTLAVTTNV